jgi:hypothetical protein
MRAKQPKLTKEEYEALKKERKRVVKQQTTVKK